LSIITAPAEVAGADVHRLHALGQQRELVRFAVRLHVLGDVRQLLVDGQHGFRELLFQPRD
jgi:hypothetical protein